MKHDAGADEVKPIEWNSWSRRGLEGLGAIFLLAGVVFFFAANWKEMSPLARFGILEAGVVIGVVASLVSGVGTNLGRWFLGGASVFTGVLIAVYGQVYQTGADAFEVFALWAVLILAWAFIAKFQPLWLLFLVVAETAMILFGGQVVVPDEIAGWSSVFLGLGLFSGAAWLVSEKMKVEDWLRITLIGVTIFWLTLIPWDWIFESSYRKESVWVHLIGTLVWLGSVIGIWRYFSRGKNVSITPAGLPILSGAFIVTCLGIRFLTEVFDQGIFTFMVAGLLAIVVFGGAAWLITQIHKQNRGAVEVEKDKEDETHWLARFALGAGAWVAGICLTIAIVITAGLSGNGTVFIFIGGIFIVGGVAILRFRKGLFLQQLGLALSLTGHISFFFGIAEMSRSNATTAALSAAIILCPIIYFYSRNSVQRYLSVAWFWLFWIIESFGSDNGIGFLVGIFLALGVICFGFSKKGRETAWFNPALVASISGLGGMLWSISSGWEDSWTLPFQIVVAIALGVSFTGLIWHHYRTATIQIQIGWLVTLCVTLVAIGIAGAPAVAASIGLMVVARAVGDRKLEWIAIIALGGFLVLFYYYLGVSLLAKSLWLIGIGIGALTLRSFIRSNYSNSNTLTS